MLGCYESTGDERGGFGKSGGLVLDFGSASHPCEGTKEKHEAMRRKKGPVVSSKSGSRVQVGVKMVAGRPIT